MCIIDYWFPGVKLVVEEAGNVCDMTLLARHPQVAGSGVKDNLEKRK